MVINYQFPTLPSVHLPPRTHHELEVVLWCRTGRAEVYIDGHAVELPAGSTLWIAAGVEHAITSDVNTVVLPIHLTPAGNRAPVASAPWVKLTDISDAAATLLMTAHLDGFTLLNTANAHRPILQAQIREMFRHHTSVTVPVAPKLQSSWIENDPETILVWCQRGQATVSIMTPGQHTRLHDITLRADQALIIPANITHRILTARGSIIIPVPLNLTASQQTFSTLQLLHIPTKIRAETIFQGIGWVTALKPNDREPTGMPLSLQPTAIDLFFETEDSHAQRIQHVQLALYKNPGHFATLDDWAQRFGISTRSLERSFNHQAGMTFGTWRQALRMHRAIDWLDEGRQVKWISCALGYANVSAFSRAFTKHNGTSARDYQIMARDTVLRLDSTR